MSLISSLASSVEWLALGRALLHSLWQGGLAMLCLAGALGMIPAKRPGVRYGLGLATLAGLVCCVAFTWQWIRTTESESDDSAGPVAAEVVAPSQTAGVNAASVPDNPTDGVERGGSLDRRSTANDVPWTTIGLGFWAMGACLMFARAGWMVCGAYDLRRRCVPLDDQGVLGIIEQLVREVTPGSRVRAFVGEHLPTAAVVGILQPCLLLPASLLTGVSPEHLRAIVAHEMAHIRRRDFLVNLGQLIVEALLFFNPFVWWISRQVRIEREACCDDLAVRVTGDATVYSQALAEAAERSIGLGAAAAFGGNGASSTLRGRIRRLLIPIHKPQFQISWFGGLIALMLVSGALALLSFVSIEAAQAVARALSDEERVEQITQVSQSHGIAPAREFGENEMVQISGTIRTWDAKPLSKQGDRNYILVKSRYRSAILASDSTYGIEEEGGVLSGESKPGTITIAAHYEGYAPAFAGPFEQFGAGRIENVDLTLERGFSTRVIFVDTEGNRVPKVTVKGGYRYDGYQSWTTWERGLADSEGVFLIEHATSDREIGFTFEAEGYESVRNAMHWLKPGEDIVQEMTPVKAAYGRVVSAATSEPIEGAELRLLYDKLGGMRNLLNLHDYAEPSAVTDGRGEFQLSQVAIGGESTFEVHAEGYRRQWLKKVEPGSGPHLIEMREPLQITGRVLGSLEHLKSKRGTGEPVLACAIVYQIDERGSTGWTYNVPVTPIDGGATFVITNLWEGHFRIEAGRQEFDFDLQESIEDLVIDLRDEPVIQGEREVVFRLKLPDGSHLQTGTLSARLEDERDGSFGRPNAYPVKNGVVRIAVGVPSKLRLEQEGMVGFVPADRMMGIRPIEVPIGDGPFEVELSVEPAGSIYGEIDPEGERLGFNFSIEDRDASQRWFFLNSDLSNRIVNTDRFRNEGRFNLTPLPLGQTYHILLRRGNTYIPCEPLTLTATNPVQRVTYALPETLRDIEGRVLLPDGTAAAEFDVSLHFVASHFGSVGSRGAITDSQGRFHIDGLNASTEGRHSLSLFFKEDYQPVRLDVPFDGKPIEIRLEQGLVIRGRLLDADTDRPVPEVDVYTYSTTMNASGKTDAEGRFEFTSLSEGDYGFGIAGSSLVLDQSSSRLRGKAGDRDEPVILRVRAR